MLMGPCPFKHLVPFPNGFFEDIPNARTRSALAGATVDSNPTAALDPKPSQDIA